MKRAPGFPTPTLTEPSSNPITSGRLKAPLFGRRSYASTNGRTLEEVYVRLNHLLYPRSRGVLSSNSNGTATGTTPTPTPSSASVPIFENHVSGLPTEIVLDILLLARPKSWAKTWTFDTTQNEGNNNLSAFVRLNLVCKHWHAVMSIHPVLWTLLPCINGRQTRQMLKLSQDAPLHVRSPKHMDLQQPWKEIFQNHHRVVTFSVELWHIHATQTLDPMINDFLNNAAKPMLEALKLGGSQAGINIESIQSNVCSLIRVTGSGCHAD
jgi:hypothetical protein